MHVTAESIKDLHFDVHTIMENLQSSLSSRITKDRIGETILILFLFLVYGMIFLSLDHAISNNIIIGSAPY